MVENQACVDTAFLSQSDSYNNTLKFSTCCAKHYLYNRSSNIISYIKSLLQKIYPYLVILLFRYGRYNTVRQLLDSEKGTFIINESDGEGLTPLHIASQQGKERW
jgi:hypothetical protein